MEIKEIYYSETYFELNDRILVIFTQKFASYLSNRTESTLFMKTLLDFSKRSNEFPISRTNNVPKINYNNFRGRRVYI
jgi:hypothetical protein